jgi:LCP family protein required for cell wall assembly
VTQGFRYHGGVTRAGTEYRTDGGRSRPLGGEGDADLTEVISDKPKRTASGKYPWHLKLLVVLGSALIVISAGVIALVYGLSDRYNSAAQHTDILGGVPQANGSANGPLNYLVLGTDSRVTDATGSRSDTILLVHINKGLGSAFIVSIPRDSYVNVPAGTGWNGGLNKINSAFSFGGPALAAKTIYNLTKIPLNGAMVINFAGVVDMVNAVGGVHVCVPYDVPNFFQDFPQYKNGWKKGCHDMKGEEAEVFMRQRHDVPGGDFGRIKSQQLVMKALAEKATSAGVVTNPAKLDSLLVTVARSLTIDKSMNLRDIAFALKGISPNNITFATAPYKGTMDTPAGSSVQLDDAADQTLFKAILDDKTTAWLNSHPQPDVATYGTNNGI